MRKFITTILLLGATFTALAEGKADTVGDVCTEYSELASSVMKARQANTSIVTVYKLADGNKIVIAMIKQAYSYPLYSTSDSKNTAVTSFSNDVFLVCYNAFDEGV